LPQIQICPLSEGSILDLSKKQKGASEMRPHHTNLESASLPELTIDFSILNA